MATADTFTIDNLKTMIKYWMIERRELLKEEKKACIKSLKELYRKISIAIGGG